MGIAQAILELRIEYTHKFNIPVFEINNGMCMKFAADIANMGFGKDVWGDDLLVEFWSDYVQSFYDDSFFDDFARYFSSIHCFIMYNGKFYDSETPQGCDYPDQLPCYQRNIDLLVGGN